MKRTPSTSRRSSTRTTTRGPRLPKRPFLAALGALGAAALLGATGQSATRIEDQVATADPAVGASTFVVFENAVVSWDPDAPEVRAPDGFAVRHRGQTIARTLDLPTLPSDLGATPRLVARVVVEPETTGDPEGRRPNDRWPRLGAVSVMVPGRAGNPVELELMRFVTGYGAGGVFEQDVTAFAPLLQGRRTLQAYVNTYSPEPGWTMSLSLVSSRDSGAPRRPSFAEYVFNNPHVTAKGPRIFTRVTIPPGVTTPRLRILSTGHATDGGAENEFVSCTHILRVDDVEVARWRPWKEGGGMLRDRNPWAGRRTIAGQEIRASDLDRSGWNPGLTVAPLILPVPELVAGQPHTIELEILDIRARGPEDAGGHHGYWAVSATVVADEPWPDE